MFELTQTPQPDSTVPVSFRADRNPYVIPEGTNVVLSVSGGRTSGYLLKQVIDANGGSLPKGCVAIFQNTGKEKEATYQFIKNMSDEWGIEIVWLEYTGKNKYKVVNFETANRTGAPFKQMVIDKSYYLPNPMRGSRDFPL